MKKLLATAMLFCVSLAVVGCGSAPTQQSKATEAFPYKIEKVHRVFAQGVGPYSVMYEGEGKVLEHRFVTAPKRPAKIVMDVEPGQPMWVQMEENLATIHIRSSDDVSPGTGKWQSGKTTENKQGNVVK